jgi:hypothetical protein
VAALLLTVILGATIPPAALDHTDERHRLHGFDPRAQIVRPYRAKLTRMAWCESRGHWGIATGNGYYGGLQFDLPTWWSVGGRGYPHWNTRLEQMFRAVRLIHRRGYQPWPVCGYA